MSESYIYFSNPGGIRNSLGQFLSAYNKLEPIYRQIADDVQAEVGKIIASEGVKRDKGKHGDEARLYNTTMSPKNRRVTKNGLDVGVHQFLKRSKSKYYRIIEEGSQTAAPKYLGPMVDKANRAPLFGIAGRPAASGRYKGYGSWQPSGGDIGTQWLRPASLENRLKMKRGHFKIPQRRVEIEPMWAYRRGWQNADAYNRLKAAWRGLLVDSGLAGTRGPLPGRYQLPPSGSRY